MRQIRRRTLLASLGGVALAAPRLVRAQSLARQPQLGILYPGVSAVLPTRLAALREGITAAGYATADQLDMVVRASEGDPTRLPGFAAELVERKVDVLIPISPAAVRAARAATTTIPVVANDLESDPVAAGFVASLARPGGNITGVFSDFPDFGTKWIELMKEAIPNFHSAVVMRDPATGPTQYDAVLAAGRKLSVELGFIDVPRLADLERAFDEAGARKPDAVIMLSSPIFGTNPGRIAALALDHRIPTATMFPEIARAGGLMAYGPTLLGAFRQTGTMIAKVLRGQQPADLPVERPTKFELVVNVKTAKLLGLTLPTTLLVRADEVIE